MSVLFLCLPVSKAEANSERPRDAPLRIQVTENCKRRRHGMQSELMSSMLLALKYGYGQATLKCKLQSVLSV